VAGVWVVGGRGERVMGVMMDDDDDDDDDDRDMDC